MNSQRTTSQANSEAEIVNKITPKQARKAAFGALVGNVMEWYDYFLFSTATALVFYGQYFISDNAATASMAAFATLAVGYIVRPLGGIIFGWLGDKAGRKAVLMLTVTGIGVATSIIGFLPNYMSIGIWAPIFLVILRLFQGLFLGGEWAGAMTLAVEHAPLKMRALMAAIPQLGSPIATIMSSGAFFLVTYFLSEENFEAWGWRLPFIAAIPLLFVSLWLRSQISETPVFAQMKEAGETAKAPLAVLFKNTWRQLLIGIAAVILGVAGFSIVTTFVLNYGTRILAIDRGVILMATMIGAVAQILVVFHAGHLAQKFGATRVVIGAGAVLTLMAFPFFMLLQTTNTVLVFLALILGLSLVSYSFAGAGTILTGLFPPTVRLSGVSIAYNGSAVIAGLSPLVATALVTMANNAYWPAAVILILFGILSVIGAQLAPRLSQQYAGYQH